MASTKKIDQLVNVARLYYEHNYTQQMIATKTGLSRPYVSKLITEARETGIVEIKIHDPNLSETLLERNLREKFGLKKVIAVPSVEQLEASLLSKLSNALSQYLNVILNDGDVIGVSWGTTLYICAMNLKIFEEIKNIRVVQMCGAISMAERDIYASEIPKKFAEALNGTAYLLPLPAVVDDINVKKAIVKDKVISEILELGKQANVAIYSIGIFDYDRTLAKAGYVSQPKVKEILNKGAVGDMCSRIINRYGQICDAELDGRTIGIELDDLRKKEYSILVAGGMTKSQCICAALNGGYANVLITDEQVGAELLQQPEITEN